MKKLILTFCSFGLAFAFQATALAQIITSQPQSVTINNASTALFTVGAGDVLSYQWQFNTTNLIDGTNSDGAVITGSTNSALTLEDVTTNEAGTYTVVVSNSITSETSSNAVLTIVPGTIVTFILSGFPDGSTSNVDVQLFNHDKPVTVQNFLHYITAGAYTNMFFDRCIPGFVLQGGDDGATDQTNTSPPMTGWDIYNMFTVAGTQPDPPFPSQIDSEFNVGPLIHNRFGTIAMALSSGNPNSASSAFFFNLADNSSNLDFQDGGFTVFGRILDGANVLQYFNALTNQNGIVTNGVFVDELGNITNLTTTNLPVNYAGTNAPANTNLVFCAFQLTNALGATNPPAVSISSPTADAVLSNGLPLTVQGIAADNNNVGLAWVRCDLIPLAAPDGTLPNGGVALTNYILGATNWSLDFETVPPGMYELGAQVQDEAGNLSPEVFVQPVIVTAIAIDGDGSVTFATNGVTNLNAVGYPFQNNSHYDLLATPDTNQVFLNWTFQGSIVGVGPELVFPMAEGLLVNATFISNGIPNSIAFTYPSSGAIIGTNTFDITGTISNAPSTPLTVICYIYSTTTYYPVAGSPFTNTGTTNWSVTVSNLPGDVYSVEAVAMDTNGNTTAISENFTVAAALQLDVVGPGTVSGASNGEGFVVGTTFEVTATPNPGQLFYTWNNGSEISLSPAQTNTMADGLTLTATFVSNTMPNSIGFTSPPASVVLSNGAVQIAGTISNAPSPPVTVTCQIFSQTNMLAVTPPLTTSGTTTWSVTASGLVAGSYIAEVEVVDQAGNSTLTNESFIAIVDTNEPVVSILYPATNAVQTDNNPVTVNGTASDSLGVAVVICFLVPMSNSDGTIPNGNIELSADAVGTTNWSLNFGIVPPGAYEIEVFARDNAGNVGQQIQPLTNSAVLINGKGSVSLTQGGVVKNNAIGYPLQSGVSYTLTATPAAGQVFIGWSAGAYTTNGPVTTFTMESGLLWTATFAPSNTGKGISFTYPAANAKLATNTFLLKGKMTSSFESARISWQISSLTTDFHVGPLLATSGTTTWSAAVSNLPPDNYLLQAAATNATGASATVSEKFSIYAFADAIGTYTGLFISTNSPVSPTNSGFVTFTVALSGKFSGKLLFPGYAPVPIYPTPFENSDFTTGIFQESVANFHGEPLNVVIYLDLNAGTGLALGTISSVAWSSPLVCYRAVTKLSTHTTPATGKYILNLQSGEQTNGPYTKGYASLAIASGGAIAVSGALPDNTTFSQSARVSKDGVWPLYAIPAGDKTNGMLMGWETNGASGNCSGQLFWYKAPNVGAYYRGGIGLASNMLLNSTGTNYMRPVTGGQYSIIFEEGTILPPLTNTLTVNKAGQFVVTGDSADKLKISLSAYGVLSGSILNPTDNKTLRFKGAFISPSQGGSGFIPDAGGQTGYFEVEPYP